MLSMLVEGVGLRSIARIKEVSINTVYKLFREAGDAAIAFLTEHPARFTCERIEADELWSWWGKRPANEEDDEDSDEPTDSTDDQSRSKPTWIWIALDPVSKFVPAYHLGTRGSQDCEAFIGDLYRRLTCRIQISTDGLRTYADTIPTIFGADVDYGMLVKPKKKMGGGRRRTGPKIRTFKQVVVGNPDEKLISTSLVEAFNLWLRRSLCRLHRRTDGWSKNEINLRRAVALYLWFYNYVQVHHSLGVTPAMASGVATARWTRAKVLAWIDEFTARCSQSAPLPVPPPPPVPKFIEGEEPESLEGAPFFVFHHLRPKYAKIHRGECVNCRYGQGKEGRGQHMYTGTWHPASTLEEAREMAFKLEPYKTDECRMCIGSYRKLGKGRPRRP